MAARNSRHAIAFVAVALLCVIGTGTALLLDRMRQTAREAADGVVQRAASVVESTVNRLFLQIDGTLASLPGLVGPLSPEPRGRRGRGVARPPQHQFPEPQLPRPAAGPPGRRRLGQRAGIVARPAIAHRPGGNRPGGAVGRRQHRRPGAEPDDGGMGAVLRAPGEAAASRHALCRGGGAHPAGCHPAEPCRRGAGPAGRRDADGWQAAGRPAA